MVVGAIVGAQEKRSGTGFVGAHDPEAQPHSVTPRMYIVLVHAQFENDVDPIYVTESLMTIDDMLEHP